MPCDIVMPLRHEEEFYAMAQRLGYDTLILAFSQKPSNISVPPVGLRVILASLDRPSPWAQLCIARAKIDSRGLIEDKKIDAVFGFETSSPKDFMHQRASGLNTVLCNLLAAKGKTAILDFSSILHARSTDRPIIMGRSSQNIRLIRDANAPVAIASFATSPYSMRAPHDLCSFFESLGMHAANARRAIEIIGEVARTKPTGRKD